MMGMALYAAVIFACVATLASAGAAASGLSCWQGLPQPSGRGARLSCNHYEATDCIYAHVKDAVAAALRQDPTNAGPLLRLHFHDAFVNGADASVLLNASYGVKVAGTAEKDSMPDLTLGGMDIIEGMKASVEAQCGPVSCADLLAVTAMWAVHLSGGPQYFVPLGRLDGCASEKTIAPVYLPSAQATVSKTYNGAKYSLQQSFQVQGLSTLDLVTLSGGHTIGQAHCANYKDRILYAGQTTPEPINASLQHKLQQCCLDNKAQPGNPKGACAGDISSPNPNNTPQTDIDAGTKQQARTYPAMGGGMTFDNAYFKNLEARMGLLTSDQSLLSDSATKKYVSLYAGSQEAFFQEWQKSVVRMGCVVPANSGVDGGAGMRSCNREPNAKGLPVCQAYPKNAYGIRKSTCLSAHLSDYCKKMV